MIKAPGQGVKASSIKHFHALNASLFEKLKKEFYRRSHI